MARLTGTAQFSTSGISARCRVQKAIGPPEARNRTPNLPGPQTATA
jgi:hypothetical protein